MRSPAEGIGTTTSQSYSDTTAAAGVAYLYRVRSVKNGTSSLPSAPDLATTILFTDAPLVAGTTSIRNVHIMELRTAMNAARATAGLGAASFTDPNVSGVMVRKVHIEELRAVLDDARSRLGLPALAYTDLTLTAGVTMAKVAHVAQLRGGVQ